MAKYLVKFSGTAYVEAETEEEAEEIFVCDGYEREYKVEEIEEV